MIRILSIENHQPLILAGLKQFLKSERNEIQISGSSENVTEALQKFKEIDFDLILLDLWIPNETPIENIRKLREYFPGKPILMYTSEDRKEWMRAMSLEGARGYVTKDAFPEEIINAIKRVSQGGVWFEDLSLTEDEKHRESQETEFAKLTMIQKRMLELFRAGNSIKGISVLLGTKTNQVEKTFERMRLKFGVKTNAELLALTLDIERKGIFRVNK